MKAMIGAALMLAAAGPATAGEFSEGSEAKEWGLAYEEKARFEAKVVDVLCELGGSCAADCGAGTRQLGLLRKADGALVLPTKNGQPAFSGASHELAPFCGKDVEVDGLLVSNEDIPGAPTVYMVQLIREAGAAEWTKANRWTKDWAEANPEAAKGKGEWFRKDPRVNAMIAESGYLGLGLETDRTFIEYYFE